eukprot:s2140_g10.t1
MLGAKPDLCNAGNMQDPQSHQPIKKGLEVHTTSQKLYDALDPLKCTRSHEHQVIEGTTLFHGKLVSRAHFSELYPRKFARLIAKTMLKQKFPLEKPVGSIADMALVAFDAVTAETHAASVKERPAKRLRKAPNRGTKSSAAAGELEQPTTSKRMRLSSTVEESLPEEPQSSADMSNVEAILKRIEAILPRVGKRQIDSPSILKDLNELVPKYNIIKVIAGKGTDRKFEPPKEIVPEEAPFRRAIMRLRESQKVSLDPTWEKYDLLSKRQLIRKSPACRANITMFAARKFENVSEPSPPEHFVQSQGDGNVPGKVESDMSPPAEEPVPSSLEGSVQPEVKIDDPVKPEDQKEANFPNTDDARTEPSNTPETGQSAQSPDVTQHMSERHGPRFRALPKEEQSMIKRAHQNLCHPSAEQLSAVLRAQGCRPEISQAVFDLKCSTCASCQKPKIQRPSTLKDALDFNDKVFIDGISWTSKAGTMFHFYHLLDQATNFHVAIPAPSRSADQAIAKVSEAWFQWAGPPNTLIMDAATEFNSESFDEFLQRHDVKGITTSPHAHWQNGRCERHGQILQSMLDKLDHEKPITTFKELQQALIQCTHAKNTLSIRAGYAPEVLVFGKSSKLPGSNISSEDVSAHASANRDDAQGIAFRQNLELRERARIAFHRADNDMALRRACLRRTRPDRQGYSLGEWVMMWQPQKNSTGYWFGPLKVIQQETNLSVWATMSGKLHRRAPEHVRPVCSDEARQISSEDHDNARSPTDISNQDMSLPRDSSTASQTNNPVGPENVEVPSDDNSSQSQDQPDTEPEGNNFNNGPITPEVNSDPTSTIHIDTPIPENDSDEQLVTSHLLCCEDEVLTVDPLEEPCAWKFELEVPQNRPSEEWACMTADEVLLATADKKQRTEDKAPLFTDGLTYLTEKTRPPAWSKVDALLETLAKGQHDWVMWLDCDSFFMDTEVRLEDLLGIAQSKCPKDPGDGERLKELVQKWKAGPQQAPDDLLEWYDNLLDSYVSWDDSCESLDTPADAPSNRTLGWADWLFKERRVQLVASEDGLMLNTGVMLARASVWSWTLGTSVYLLQFPFVLAAATDPAVAAKSQGYATAWSALGQKTINGYPPLVSSALLTHTTFEPGDFIVSFSGCKIYSSQEVCNQLFLNYFFQVHSLPELADDPALQPPTGEVTRSAGMFGDAAGYHFNSCGIARDFLRNGPILRESLALAICGRLCLFVDFFIVGSLSFLGENLIRCCDAREKRPPSTGQRCFGL